MNDVPGPQKIGKSYVVRALKDKGPSTLGWLYRLEWYEGGKLRTLALGRQASPEQALHEGVRRVAERPSSAAAPTRQGPRTMAQLLEAAHADIAEDPNLRPSTRKGYKLSIEHLLGFFESIRVDRVTYTEVEDYVKARRREKAAPNTIGLELAVLSRTWKWARRRGLVPGVDLPLPTIKKESTRRAYIPSPGEIRDVIAWCEVHAPPWVRLALALLWGTGARIDEIASLRWQDVDLEKNTLHLTGRYGGKTGARTLPVKARRSDPDPDWWALLRQARGARLAEIESGGFTFDPASRLLPVTYESCVGGLGKTWVARACEATGVPRFSCHSVRHAAVTEFIERCNPSPADIKAWFGHSYQVSISRYTHPRPGRLAEMATKAGLGSLEGGTVVPFRRGGDSS